MCGLLMQHHFAWCVLLWQLQNGSQRGTAASSADRCQEATGSWERRRGSVVSARHPHVSPAPVFHPGPLLHSLDTQVVYQVCVCSGFFHHYCSKLFVTGRAQNQYGSSLGSAPACPRHFICQQWSGSVTKAHQETADGNARATEPCW